MQANRIYRYLIIVAGLLLLGLIVFTNRGLAGAPGGFLPGSALWAHLILLALETLALVWFWRGLAKSVNCTVDATDKVTGGAVRMITKPFRRKKRRG